MEKIKIGEKIRLLRKRNDVTQDQLAAYLKVTPQAVSRWESGICYPDMSCLPAIADYFSVSMDELLCYTNNQQEQRIRDYLAKADELLEEDRIVEALELLRTAMADIPSSCALQLETAQVLSMYASMVEEKSSGHNENAKAAIQTALGEAVSLCRHILEECTDDTLRDETKKTLCDMYAHQLGDSVQALEIADRFHDLAYSREIIKATVLTGHMAFEQAQKNLIAFADNIWWHLYNLACVPDISGDTYTAEQKIHILQKGIEIFAVIFEENPLFYADRLANSYRQIALLHLSQGNMDSALTALEKMADCAVMYDARPEKANYTSILIDGVTYEKSADGEERSTNPNTGKCARLASGLMNGRAFQTLHTEPRFRAILDTLNQNATK